MLLVGFLISTVVFQSHIDIKYRNIRCTRFDSLGTRHFLGKTVHSGIYLLIHLYKCQVGIHSKVKFQTDHTRPVILAIGDSLTEGDYGVKVGVACVKEENYPYFLTRYLDVPVKNYGVCGITAGGMEQRYREGFFSAKEGNLAVVMLGTNWGLTVGNADNYNAYDRLLTAMKTENPALKIVLLLPPNATTAETKPNFGYMPNVLNARDGVRKLAEKHALPVLSADELGGFSPATEAVCQPRDGLHFGRLGYLKLAFGLGNALKALFPELFAEK